MNINLKNKHALVTGAGSGIGREIALGLAEAGAKVAVHYGSNVDGANEVVNKIKELGSDAIAVKADVRNKAEVQQLIEKCNTFFNGQIDILVNNAGHLVERCKIEDMSEELWHKIIDVNLTSAFLVTQAVIPFMKENGGNIINMTSLAAHNGGGNGAVAYATSKGGLMTFTKGLAKELAPEGITVNAVSPGFIGKTAFHDTFTSNEAREATVNSIPLKREGEPKDVLGAVLYFVSDLGSYITGETVEVNGGLFMR